MADEYTKVNINSGDATPWDSEKDKELEGIFVDKKSNIGANQSNLYTVQKEDGSFVSFWGSAVIDSNFDKIPLGAQIKIVYLGKQKNTKGDREFKNFDIYSKQIKVPTQAPEQSDEIDASEIPF